MYTLKQVLIQLLMAAPLFIEAFIIDPIIWKRKPYPESDKPVSTYLRLIFIIGMGIIVQFWIKDNWAILAMLGVIVYYFSGFNYMVNLRLGQPMSYKQYNIPGLPWWQILAVLIFIVIYLSFNSSINQGASIPFNLPRYR